MKKYWSFFKMRLMAGLQYRAAALAGMSTQIVWGAMEILLYRAFWLEHPERFPMGMEALSSYIWLQQAFLTFFSIWSWDFDILKSVKTGSVAYELLRPAGIYGMWMAKTLAMRLSRAALRMIPIIVLGSLIPAPWGLRLRVSPAVFGLFLMSMVLMLLVVCSYTLFIYSLTFHLTDPNGIMVLSVAAADLLGGHQPGGLPGVVVGGGYSTAPAHNLLDRGLSRVLLRRHAPQDDVPVSDNAPQRAILPAHGQSAQAVPGQQPRRQGRRFLRGDGNHTGVH